MLRDTDLTSSHQVEGVRRSVAMLNPGAPALDREDSLRLLRRLVEANRQLEQD